LSDQLFAPVESVEEFSLHTDDGHRVYFERFGNPNGVPLVFLHGGPGSGASKNQRRLFDPQLFNVVIVDQRGSGRSWPLAEDPAADRSSNTTHHLIADLEQIRELLGIETWILAGFSWGTTLALAYACYHPGRVRGIMAALVTTTSRHEVKWITHDVGEIFPIEHHRFAAFVADTVDPNIELSIVSAYASILWGPHSDRREQAAIEWCRWEDAHVSLAPGHQHNTKYDDPDFRIRFARLVTHYWSNSAFLGDDFLLRLIPAISGIPMFFIHGKYDVSSPLSTAWRLSRSIDSAELIILDESGHGDGQDFLPAVLGSLRKLGEQH